MSTMLPSTPKTFGDIRHVFSSALSAVLGQANHFQFRTVKQAVVVLVDGLGAHNIRERAGHAPFLASMISSQKNISVGFPTTTATSITSFATGMMPGQHGIVGYRIQDPVSKNPINLLSGWNSELTATDWQRNETVSDISSANQINTYFIGSAEYQSSGFTSITMPQAKFLASNGIQDSFDVAINLLERNERSLSYLYLPQLDQTAHALGWQSSKWAELLELVDSGLERLSSCLTKQQGACLTADHGVVDVADSNKFYLDEIEQPSGGISLVGGDTRAIMLYLKEPQVRREYANTLKKNIGNLAWVLTKEEILKTGWYGEFAEGIVERLPDISILAKSKVAFYHREFASVNSLKMIGHHGSLTSEELQVPLVRLGQFV